MQQDVETGLAGRIRYIGRAHAIQCDGRSRGVIMEYKVRRKEARRMRIAPNPHAGLLPRLCRSGKGILRGRNTGGSAIHPAMTTIAIAPTAEMLT